MTLPIETKGLVAGLVFTLGIFGAKAGLGLGVRCASGRSLGRVVLAGGVYLVLMAVIFAGGHILARAGDPGRAEALVTWLAGKGMTIHLFMWAGLTAWGVHMLTRNRGGDGSRAWLMLMAPCPVCLTVILLDLFLFAWLWPGEPLLSVGLPFLFFAGAAAAAALLSFLAVRQGGIDPARAVGWIMFFCGIYFLFSIALLPHFREAEQIYEVAQKASLLQAGRGGEMHYPPLLVLGLLFTAGMAFNRGCRAQGGTKWK